jgi:chemotaxis protein MotA
LRRIALSTVGGVIIGSGIIVWGVTSATTKWQVFVSFSSLLIVLGGTITSSFIGYKAKYIYEAILYIFQSFLTYKITPLTLKKDVAMMIDWSKRISRNGEQEYDKIVTENRGNSFIKYIFSLMSTGYGIDDIKLFGETSIEEEYFRKICSANILKTMASSAPAFGMVGTLIGLIVMLGEMENPAAMGPGLSVALITTLYGVVLARFIFSPTSTKVSQNLSIMRFREFLILEGITLIIQKKSPFYIQDRLNSYINRKYHYDMTKESKK